MIDKSDKGVGVVILVEGVQEGFFLQKKTAELTQQVGRLTQQAEEAHSQLDMLGVPRKDAHEQIYTLASQLELLREKVAGALSSPFERVQWLSEMKF